MRIKSFFIVIIVLTILQCQAQRGNEIWYYPNDIKTDFHKGKTASCLKNEFGLSDDYDFKYTKLSFDFVRQPIENGDYYTEFFQQYYKGLRISGSGFAVIYFKNNAKYIDGRYFRCDDFDTTFRISREQALIIAEKYEGCKIDTNDDYFYIEKIICRNGKNLKDTMLHTAYLVYTFDDIFIDAKTGEILNVLSWIRDADGTAATRYSGIRGITTKQSGQIYVLQDITRGNGIETLNLKQACKDSLKNVTNGFLDSNAVNFTDSNNQWTYAEFHNAKKDDGALDAHWGMIKTYDYFKQVHGRNGFDGQNTKIKSYIHYGTNFSNACWMGKRKVFIFGDGTDTVSKDIYTALDIIGHEFGHAICQYSAQLVYKGESGAINEALSDIWGACVEYWADSNKQSWLIGEDIGSPIRSMSNPKSYSKPNTYKGQYWKDTNFTADNGGVHTNCCVVDYWFYLLSVGGSGTNDFQNDYNVSGIGITKAAKIVYSAEENMGVGIDRSNDINFFKFKHYTIRAAETLYGIGSQEVKSVKDAWYAVGVYSDLFICDTATDYGTMPSNATRTWCSPDIWITNPDSTPVDEIYSGRKYKVWVRIYNRTSVASSGNELLFLNWAKAGFNEYWNDNWTRNHPYPSPCYAIKGDTIGNQNGIPIPSVPANGHRDVGVLWWTPIENYEYCTEFMNEKWHYCILARVHDDDTIAHENEQFVNVHDFIRNHNNVASRNITIKEGSVRKAVIQINNATVTGKGRIICFVPKEVNGSSITDYAEVYITLDAGLLNAINSSNISGLTWGNSNTLRWNGGSACIPVTLPANSYYTMQTTVHFLADQIPATNIFDFDIVLRNATGDSILGGEHYKCIRTNGRFFQAMAHDDMTILWGETASLYATDILETAEYKWYNDQGNEVGDGLACNVSPQQNSTYTLRVTADADGYRAYSTVTVLVVDGELRLLAPNPADNQVRIGYALSRNVSSATLQIINGSGQVVHSQMLNGGNGSKVTGETLVNTSSLAAGSYSVRLVSNRGNIFDSKTLIIQ